MFLSSIIFGRHLSSLIGHFNPRMLQNLVRRVPLQRVDLQHPGDQLLGRIGDLVPVRRVELENSAQDLIEELLLVVGARREGRVPDEQDVHDHTRGPDVHLDPVAGFGQDFGSDVRWCAADLKKSFLLTYQFGIKRFTKKNISSYYGVFFTTKKLLQLKTRLNKPIRHFYNTFYELILYRNKRTLN